MLLRPGLLTVAYLEGRRKLYTLPLQLFLVANILFFAMQSLTGAKIFSTPLDQHLHSDMWSSVAQKLVARHVQTRRTTEAQYAPVFNQAVAQNGKSLIVLMVLPFALLPAILFRRSGRPFVAHIVFSLHFYAFLMFLFCLFLIVVGVSLLAGGRGLDSESFDHALSIAALIVCATYLYIAAKTVYGAKGIRRILKTALRTVAVVGTFLGYRFALLWITLQTT